MVGNVLVGVGFDKVPEALGLTSKDAEWQTKPSGLVGKLCFVVILFLGLSQAVSSLQLTVLNDIFNEVLAFAGPVLVGVVIVGIGLWLANLASRGIEGSNMSNADLMSKVAYAGIMVLTAAVALRRMGLADDIVNMAFGLTMGAIAVAAALAFGLGGRDAAAKFLEQRAETNPPKRRATKRR